MQNENLHRSFFIVRKGSEESKHRQAGAERLLHGTSLGSMAGVCRRELALQSREPGRKSQERKGHSLRNGPVVLPQAFGATAPLSANRICPIRRRA